MSITFVYMPRYVEVFFLAHIYTDELYIKSHK